MRNYIKENHKKIFTCVITVIVILGALNIFKIQNPWTLDGWYRCAETEGYPIDSGEEIYLVMGDDVYAVIRIDENGAAETLQTGAYKKDDNKDTRAVEYAFDTNGWKDACIIYHRLPGSIILNSTTGGSKDFNMVFAKTGARINLEVPEVQQ